MVWDLIYFNLRGGFSVDDGAKEPQALDLQRKIHHTTDLSVLASFTKRKSAFSPPLLPVSFFKQATHCLPLIKIWSMNT